MSALRAEGGATGVGSWVAATTYLGSRSKPRHATEAASALHQDHASSALVPQPLYSLLQIAATDPARRNERYRGGRLNDGYRAPDERAPRLDLLADMGNLGAPGEHKDGSPEQRTADHGLLSGLLIAMATGWSGDPPFALAREAIVSSFFRPLIEDW